MERPNNIRRKEEYLNRVIEAQDRYSNPRMPRHPNERVVKLILAEVKYEVKFDSWLREKIINQRDKNINDKAETVDYAYKNDKAEDWLIRQIEDAVDRIYGELSWCLVDRAEMTTDEILRNPDEWDFHFVFGPNWNGSMTALKAAIRKFVGESVLFQWYRATLPNDAEKYGMVAEEALMRAYEIARSERVQLPPWNL